MCAVGLRQWLRAQVVDIGRCRSGAKHCRVGWSCSACDTYCELWIMSNNGVEVYEHCDMRSEAWVAPSVLERAD